MSAPDAAFRSQSEASHRSARSKTVRYHQAAVRSVRCALDRSSQTRSDLHRAALCSQIPTCDSFCKAGYAMTMKVALICPWSLVCPGLARGATSSSSGSGIACRHIASGSVSDPWRSERVHPLRLCPPGGAPFHRTAPYCAAPSTKSRDATLRCGPALHLTGMAEHLLWTCPLNGQGGSHL